MIRAAALGTGIATVFLVAVTAAPATFYLGHDDSWHAWTHLSSSRLGMVIGPSVFVSHHLSMPNSKLSLDEICEDVTGTPIVQSLHVLEGVTIVFGRAEERLYNEQVSGDSICIANRRGKHFFIRPFEHPFEVDIPRDETDCKHRLSQKLQLDAVAWHKWQQGW
ncbi:hypothetical protein [Stratiformator vulcanicus]|uniref:Uncharacterized protein n=1 Tax=Stratiformator vulcanicus TaxID=2527980 RepID=A0A517R776_9PLAN|nr:hypothetical protein [Stratiformator vulcanicus]QDT39683.1 hypothetical protein Pan189_40920 [Stratiformator vulcanicus]